VVITRIAPMSAAKISGLLYALFGFIAGALISLFMTVLGGMVPSDSDAGMGFPMVGMFFGAGAIIMLPIFYGILGFIGGAIGAFLYNLVAGWIGGIEMDVR
jgi:hypothetical protein